MKKIITSAVVVAGLAMSAQTMAQDTAAAPAAKSPLSALQFTMVAKSDASSVAGGGSQTLGFLGLTYKFTDMFSGQALVNYDNKQDRVGNRFNFVIRAIADIQKDNKANVTLSYRNYSSTDQDISAGLLFHVSNNLAVQTDMLSQTINRPVSNHFQLELFNNVEVQYGISIPMIG